MTLEEAAAYFAETAPRGEFVLIVEGAPEMPEVDNDAQMEAALQMVQERIRKGETLKDAVKAVSAEQGVKKNALYQRAIDTE
jgi:16S rRNA (cytidine1402-2'-O)-methyltransferase